MRAWQVTGVGRPATVLDAVSVPIPEPGDGEVRVHVAAAALGLPDVLMCRGTYPLTPDGRFTPGQDLCGTIDAVGPGVDPALVGSRVMGVSAFYAGKGALAEYALARPDTLYPVPDDMRAGTAAAFSISFHTAWIGLVDRGRVAEGDTVLVLGGAGGSGAAAVTLAHNLGATVIAVAGGPEKTAWCLHLGADHVIDHTEHDLIETVRAQTGSVDVIFDPVGGDAAAAALRTLGSGGRHLAVGFASGAWVPVDAADVAVRNYSVVGVYTGAYDRTQALDHHHQLLDLHQRGLLADIVTETVGFAEVPEALDRLARRRTMGRVAALIGS